MLRKQNKSLLEVLKRRTGLVLFRKTGKPRGKPCRCLNLKGVSVFLFPAKITPPLPELTKKMINAIPAKWR